MSEVSGASPTQFDPRDRGWFSSLGEIRATTRSLNCCSIGMAFGIRRSELVDLALRPSYGAVGCRLQCRTPDNVSDKTLSRPTYRLNAELLLTLLCLIACRDDGHPSS